MTAQLIGQVSIGQCIPTSAALIAEALAKVQADLAGALALQAAISITPPTLAVSLTAALDLVAQLRAQIALGISLGLPEISIDLSATLAIIADLNVQVGILLALSVTLGTAGVYVIKHEGAEQTFGPEMQAQVSAIAPPGNNVHAVTFLATDPAVFEALGKVLLTG